MFVRYCLVIVVACSLQLAKAGLVKNVTELTDKDTRVVFPGPVQYSHHSQDVTMSRFGKENVTDPCEGLAFCTVKPPDYPQELFNKMFKGKITEPLFQPNSTIDNRQGDPDEIEDCDSTVSFDPVYKVRNLKGEMVTIVQAAEVNYLQVVRLETCNKPDAKCFTQFKAPDDVEAFCKQTYNEWEFLVHDGKDGTKKEKVLLPVCCSCHYRPT